ncbi:unnamed protein product [Cladocopium goreaui]|uniref:Deoxynucleoside triphosphate triphosphohydrolase SAMHD1 n=1 Tax=Cladocopium goreaui TaxID=2562237 RepID=A0A9P1FPS4_9DINO|nr:unnamed protein product [Cladocopium goreaui]
MVAPNGHKACPSQSEHQGRQGRQHHNINLKFVMKQRGDLRFVDGELRVARAFSTLQTSSDSEFAIQSMWQDLGGSKEAAAYLDMDQLDNTPAAFWMTCNEEQEGKAKKRCSKHLGAEMANGNAEDSTFFEDCVYDVCHGAGEAAAELAAELLASTRAV